VKREERREGVEGGGRPRHARGMVAREERPGDEPKDAGAKGGT